MLVLKSLRDEGFAKNLTNNFVALGAGLSVGARALEEAARADAPSEGGQPEFWILEDDFQDVVRSVRARVKDVSGRALEEENDEISPMSIGTRDTQASLESIRSRGVGFATLLKKRTMMGYMSNAYISVEESNNEWEQQESGLSQIEEEQSNDTYTKRILALGRPGLSGL